MTVWDVVVVGGGAAGLSAALTLGRARRRVLVIDAGEPRNARAEGVHVFLTRDGTPPAELLRLGRVDVQTFGGTVQRGRVVEARRLAGHPEARFEVRLDDGTTVQARRLVIASGVVDELPDVAGLAEQWGTGVIHCPYCHGWEVQDEAIGILGSGDRAAFQALLFRQWSPAITLFLHTAPEPTEEQREQLTARGIEVVTGTVTRVCSDPQTGLLSGVELEGGMIVPLKALAVASRITADETLLGPLGVTVLEHPSGAGTYAVADDFGAAAEGVWVSGNVANPMAQVMTAAAASLMVGVAVNNDLMAEELQRAVTARRSREAPR